MLDLRPAPGFVPLLELAVAAMLIVLGLDLLRRRVPGTDTTTARVRPFLVGMVHGLAGSAGLMIVVAATIAERWLALAYAGAFGAGTVAGMRSRAPRSACRSGGCRRRSARAPRSRASRSAPFSP